MTADQTVARTGRPELEAVIRRQLANIRSRPHTGNECTDAILAAVDKYTGADDPALHFELDRHSSVMLDCPDCDELLWLTDDEAPTLADVLKAAREHKCPVEDEE